VRKNNYHYSPSLKFHGDGPYYLGVELEVEAPDYSVHDTGIRLIGDRQQAFYAKRDGSLLNDGNLGFEIVTHPISPALWLEELPAKVLTQKAQPKHPVAKFLWYARKLRELGFKSHDGGRCGLHVHVSRTAFSTLRCPKTIRRNWTGEVSTATAYQQSDNLRNPHYYWFYKLINGRLFKSLSQRSTDSLDQWAMQRPRKVRERWDAHTQARYSAVNLQEKTAEVRVFRGNMREDRIRKALEAVIAAVEFSRHRAARAAGESLLSVWQTSLDASFIRWVQERAASYRNLLAYLQETGAIRSSDLQEVTVNPSHAVCDAVAC
jgi:hypothetical protein